LLFNTESLSDQAERALKEEILSGRLAPEQRLDLNAYAARWHLSPTPLRDAVKQLEAQGFVEVSPRRGAFVARIDGRALKEIFQLRVGLECLAVELSIENIPLEEAEAALASYRATSIVVANRKRKELLSSVDNLVHNLVVKHCGNSRLQKTMDSLNDLIRWSRWICYSTEPIPYEAALPEHLEICEALCLRDAEAAVAAMRRHLLNTFHRIDAQLKLKQSLNASEPKELARPTQVGDNGGTRK
jgi:DNA-binding GntR family transcriptional regulator